MAAHSSLKSAGEYPINVFDWSYANEYQLFAIVRVFAVCPMDSAPFAYQPANFMPPGIYLSLHRGRSHNPGYPDQKRILNFRGSPGQS